MGVRASTARTAEEFDDQFAAAVVAGQGPVLIDALLEEPAPKPKL